NQLRQWGESLNTQADILIYGCNLVSSDNGQTLIDQLSELTLADIAASDDITGHAELGGDWELEYTTGNIETNIVIPSYTQTDWQVTLDITSSLVAHYTFDEGSGSTAFDSSASANNGSLIGSPVYSTGIVGSGALNFSGDFDYVEAPDAVATDFGSGDFSVGFWFNSTSLGATARLVGDSIGADGYIFYSSGAGDVNFFTVSGGQSQLLTAGGLFDGNWHHVVGTRSGSDFSLYIDNTLADSATNALIGSVDNTVALRMGATDGVSSDYDGLLDEVRLYNRALTSSDITELYNNVGNIPVIISSGGNDTANISVIDGTTSIATVSAIDNNSGTMTYSISGGDDALKFLINPSTGVLTFASAPDFSSPTDTNLDNIYKVIVQASDGIDGSDTQAIDVTVTAFTYPISYGANNTFEWITNVTFAGINNTTGQDGGGYGDYTAQFASVVAGTSNDLSITINADSEEYINAWIDWNQDGDFLDLNESYTLAANVGAAGPYTLSILAPTDAAAGTTVMRTSVKYQDAPASNEIIGFGEVEDYSITVTSNSTPVANADSVSTVENSALIISPLTNDTDTENDTLSIIDFTQPTNGTVVNNNNGTFTYTPDTSYVGTDSFDYVISDSAANLSHYWNLDGSAVDTIGATNGTLSGTTTVAGKVGNGLSFNESGDHVEIPDISYNSDFSISLDIKIDDNTGTLFQYFYSHGDVNTTNSINIFLNEASHGTDPNVLRTVIRDADDTLDNTALQFDISSIIGDGQWHTYTATAGSSGIEVFLDGISQASDVTRATGGINPTGSLYLGARLDLAADRYFGGSLDSLRIYDTALRSSQISDIASNANQATVNITITPAVTSLTVDTATNDNDSGITDGNASQDIAWLNLNKGGDAAISLREAIIAANNTSGTDTINFNIAGTGTHTISLTSALPAITEAVIINGTTETDFSGTPLIAIDGSSAGVVNGLWLQAGSDGSTIRGLQILNAGNDGITIDSSNNLIAGNYIGTDGIADLGSTYDGIRISGSNNIIGGTTASDRNVIAGNNDDGIQLQSTATGTIIAGNYIGVNASGLASIGNGSAGIELSGTTQTTTIGGTVANSGNIIGGNQNGIVSYGSDNNTISGNYIGIGSDGLTDVGNSIDGIRLESGSTNNVIGGTTTNERNIISGNNDNGIFITGSGTTNNTVQGNFIGTDITGTISVGNTAAGIEISSNADANIIGGTTVAARNIISGNSDGIYIQNADGTIIKGNYIGTDVTGLLDLGNSDRGIQIESGADNTIIGGTTSAARNVISGNNSDGIIISDGASPGTGTTGTVIQGNYIGVGSDSTTAIGNGTNGIRITTESNHTIGGTEAGAGNIIAFNAGDGILLSDNAATDNTILGNSIHSNTQQGIDLGNDGVTANDLVDGDGDTGANSLQNFPVLFAATVSGANTTITGQINSNPNTTYRIEFFSSPVGTEDPSGHGEGETYLGYISVTTDINGDASINAVFGIAVAANDRVSSTATVDLGSGNYGATSEFSMNVITTSPSVLTQTLPGAQSIGENQTLTFNATNGNAVSVSDTDGTTDTRLQVFISVNNGILTLSQTTGLSILGGANASSFMTVHGSESDLNAALEGMTFTPDTSFSGAVSLQMTTSLGADMTGYYSFDAGNAIDDSVGISQNGAFIGQATTVVDGTRGTVLSLDGTGDSVQIPGMFVEPSNVTLSAWVNIAAGSGGDAVSLGDNVSININEFGSSISGIFYDGAFRYITANSVTIDGGGWHHVAFSFDDANNTQTLYLDGAAVATATFTSSISYTQGTDTFIGNHGNGLADYDIEGLIDDARIYARALSADEIAALASDNTSVSDNVAITVTAANNAPTVGGGSLPGITEDLTNPAGETISNLFSGSFNDVDAGSSMSGVLITNNPENASQGTWQYSTDTGSNWYNIGNIAYPISLALDTSASIRFVPSTDYNGSPDVLSLRALDNTYSGGFTSGATTATADASSPGGSSSISSSLVSISTVVTAVNDAPVLPAAGGMLLTSITEDDLTNNGNLISEIIGSVGGNAITDVDAGALEGIAITSLNSSNGNWQYNIGGGWFDVGSVSFIESFLLRDTDRLRFVPDGLNADMAFITFSAWDQTTGTAGTKADTSAYDATGAYSFALETASISVSAVNDAPIADLNGSSNAGNNFSTIFNEGDLPVNVFDTGATISDADNNSYLSLDINLSGFLDGTVEEIILAGNQFQYSSAETIVLVVGTTSFNVIFDGSGFTISNDLGGTMPEADLQSLLRGIMYEHKGGAPTVDDRIFSITPQDADGLNGITSTSTISVGSTNTAPIISSNNGANTFEEGSVTITQAMLEVTDVDNTPSQIIYTITADTTHGTLYKNITALGIGSTFTQADINAGSISYQDTDVNTTIDNFSFTVSDGAGGSISTTQFDITVNNINDAPQGANNTITTPEDVDYVFTASDFGFTDSNDSPANNLLNVIISAAPTVGTLYIDTNGDALVDGGETIVDLDSVAIADIIAGKLKFKPTTDANGTSYDSFTFQVQDDGGTANSGVNTDQSANTINIDVTAVNDSGSISGNTAGSAAEGVVVTGTLTASDADGLTDGSYFSISGTPASNGTPGIDAASGAWTYTPSDANWFGSDSFEVTVTDDEGGMTTQAVSITITNTDDAASIGGNTSGSAAEGVVVTGTLTASDADGLT
ncbi:MAG: LamG-like jellyroll fold domain-containing protein, partial [Pseudomonadales bacterium]